MNRKAEILLNNIWKEIKFEEIRKNNIFRLFDHEPVMYEDGSKIYKAIGDPYINKLGLWEIQVEDN